MGESYKGLTIRIGADTSSLQYALKGIQSSLTATQSDLSKMNKVLRLDPTNLVAYGTKMQDLGGKAQTAFERMNMLEQEAQQLGSQTVYLREGTTTVGALADKTENASLAAEHARENYYRLEYALAALHDKLAEVAKANDIKWDKNDIEGSINKLREAGLVSSEDEQKLNELGVAFKEAGNAYSSATAVEQLKRLDSDILATKTEAEGYVKSLTAMKATDPTGNMSEKFKQAKVSIEQADTATNALDEQLKQLNHALELDPSNMDAAVLKFGNLQAHISTSEDKLKALKSQLQTFSAGTMDRAAQESGKLATGFQKSQEEARRVNTELESTKGLLSSLKAEADTYNTSVQKSSPEYQKLKTQIAETETKVKELTEAQKLADTAMKSDSEVVEYNRIKTAIAETESQVKAYTEQIKYSKSQSKIGPIELSTWKSLGMTFYSTVTPAVLGFGYVAVNSANTIDSAFRDMKKTVNGTDEQFNTLKQDAIDFSLTHVTTADQMLEIEAMGGQLGISADNLENFANTVSNIDIATNIDADTAAQDLGQLSNILTDLTDDKFTAFSDALVRLGNNSPTLESNIIDITTRIGSMGSIIGMSTPDILAWSTAVASTGQDSEAAGTAISKTMSDIETSVSAGGDSLQSFADVAGMSAEDFASKWKSDASGTLEAFVKGLKNIKDNGGSVDSTLENLGITSVRQKQALEGLTQTTDVLDSSLQMSSDAWNGVSDQWGAAGDAAREASQKSEGFSGTLQMLKNNASALGSTMGESLTPLMGYLADALKWVNDGMSSLFPRTREIITSTILLTAALGPLFTVVASIGKARTDIIATRNAAKSAFEVIAKDATKGTASITALSAAEVQQVDASKAVNAANKEQSASTLMLKTSTKQVSDASKVATTNTKTLSREQKVLTGTSKAAAAAMGLLKMTAATLAIAGIALLISKISEANEREKTFTKITQGMYDVTKSLGDTAKVTSDAISSLGSTTGDTQFDLDTAIDKSASYVDSMKDISDNANTSMGMLGAYKEVIDQVADGSLTGEDAQSQLEWAIKGVNDACGTEYSAQDLLNGALSDQVGNIDSVIDANQRLIEVEAIKDELEKAYEKRITDEKNLSDAQNQIKADEETINSNPAGSKARSDALKELITLQEGYSGLEDAIDHDNKDIDYFNGLLAVTSEAAGSTAQALGDVMKASSYDMFPDVPDDTVVDIDAFATALQNAGVKASDLAQMNPQVVGQIAQDWRDGKGDISDICKQYGLAVSEGVADGEQSGTPDVQAATDGVNAAATPADQTANGTQAGTSATQSLSTALQNGTPLVTAAARGIANAERQANVSGESGTWANDLVQNIIDKFNSRSGEVGAAAASVANAISAYLHQSVADVGPLRHTDQWGGDLVDNIINDMKSRHEALAEEAKNTANIIASAYAPMDLSQYAYDSDSFGIGDYGAFAGSLSTSNVSNSKVVNLYVNGIKYNTDDYIDGKITDFADEMIRLKDM